LGRLLQAGLSAGLGLLLYTSLAGALRVPEAQQMISQVRGRLPRLGRA
jgi:hypothetical protein